MPPVPHQSSEETTLPVPTSPPSTGPNPSLSCSSGNSDKMLKPCLRLSTRFECKRVSFSSTSPVVYFHTTPKIPSVSPEEWASDISAARCGSWQTDAWRFNRLIEQTSRIINLDFIQRKQLVRENYAARTIQAAFRGWFVRQNMSLSYLNRARAEESSSSDSDSNPPSYKKPVKQPREGKNSQRRRHKRNRRDQRQVAQNSI